MEWMHDKAIQSVDSNRSPVVFIQSSHMKSVIPLALDNMLFVLVWHSVNISLSNHDNLAYYGSGAQW